MRHQVMVRARSFVINTAQASWRRWAAALSSANWRRWATRLSTGSATPSAISVLYKVREVSLRRRTPDTMVVVETASEDSRAAMAAGNSVTVLLQGHAGNRSTEANLSADDDRFPQVGQVIAGYRLERKLSSSAHGVSFQAHRVAAEPVTWTAAMTPERVVFKALETPTGLMSKSDELALSMRFERQTLELQAVCGVLIPTATTAGAAQFISWGGAPQQPYLVRSFISGYSLAERLAQETQGLPLPEIASYITCIAAALDYAHERNVWHGACTLENVLISQDGDLTVTDFGLERLLAPLRGRTSALPRLELARYLAPERFVHPERLTAAGDIYSLGVALYALLCNAYPFNGATIEDVRQAQQTEQCRSLFAYRADVTDEIEAVVARALSPYPQERFASAGALAHAFTSTVELALDEELHIAPHLAADAKPFGVQLGVQPSQPDEAPIQTVRQPISPLEDSSLTHVGATTSGADVTLTLDLSLRRVRRTAAPIATASAETKERRAVTGESRSQTSYQRVRWLAPALSLDGVISLVVLVAALVINLHLLPSISLYFDEAMSVETARQSPGVLASYLWGYQNQMPLYYALLSVWLHLLHVLGITATELLVRIPSVTFASLAAVVVYFIGRRFWSQTVGLVSAALYVLNTLQLFHAQKARAYPLQLLMLNISWYAFFLVLSGKDRRRRVWLVYVIALVLALYAQPYSALVVAAQVTAFAWYVMVPGPWRTHARSALRSLIVSLGALVALALPLGADYALHGQPNSFVPIAHLQDLPNFFLRIQFGAPSHQYALAFAKVLSVLAALGIGASALWNLPRTSKWLRRTQEGTGPLARAASMLAYLPPGAAALVAWVVAPMALAFVTTQPYLNMHLFYWRYLVVVIPPFCLLMGVGVSVIRLPVRFGGSITRLPVAQTVLALTLVVLVLPQTLGYYAHAEISDFRTPAAWINAHYSAGDGIVCLPGRQCSVPLEYYLTTDPGPAHLTSSSPGAWLWVPQRQVRVDPAYVEKYSARQPSVFFIEAAFGMSAKQLAQSQQERAWLDSHERLVAACAALTVTVRLYAAGPPAPGQADASTPHC